MDNEIYLPADEFFELAKPTGLTFDDLSLATRFSSHAFWHGPKNFPCGIDKSEHSNHLLRHGHSHGI